MLDMILDRAKRSSGIEFYKNDKEYYISLSNVLFFETNSNKEIDAHTRDEVYKVKYKLYELEEILSSEFVRVSKSAIININKIYSIGAVQMYFDKDNIKDGEGILRINSVCSGVELYVPKEWRVVSEINNILSGISEEGIALNEKKAVLRLVGISKLSGITIKYI